MSVVWYFVRFSKRSKNEVTIPCQMPGLGGSAHVVWGKTALCKYNGRNRVTRRQKLMVSLHHLKYIYFCTLTFTHCLGSWYCGLPRRLIEKLPTFILVQTCLTLLCAFSWVVHLRLNCICRRFGTHSDVWELPRRKYTTFRTRRKFEICFTLSAFSTFLPCIFSYFQQRTVETAVGTTTLGERLVCAFIERKRPVPDMQYIPTVPAYQCVGIP